MNSTHNFRNALRNAGLPYARPITPDGRLHRFKAADDAERNSWYVLFNDSLAAGAFGCWKRGIKKKWCARNGSLSQADRQQLRRYWEQAERKRKRAEAEARKKARRVATWILSRSKPVIAHPYLVQKGVKSFGNVREYRGALVVPLHDAKGVRHSLQFIGTDGTKRFLRGGRTAGCFFTLAEEPDAPLVLCEGYATGGSIHEATGFAVACAMNAGNIMAVAKAMRSKFPKRDIVIAVDSDQWTDGNPGLTKATDAAKAIGARLAVPQFKDIATKPTDFNDLHLLEGINTVRTQINAATLSRESEADAFTPNDWFKRRFPKLADQHGEPVQEIHQEHGLPRVTDISEDFIAATMGSEGQPDVPTIFLPTEERFYSYEPTHGIFVHRREPELSERLSRLLLECSRACKGQCNVSKLEFGLRDTGSLGGVLRRARATLRVSESFFHRDVAEFIPCANGMLSLADRRLLPFSASHRCRNKLAVPFDSGARCPLFLETLMRPALDADDLNLVQRWFGLALLGENLAQRLLLLTGTAGGGKGALVRVVCGIIGSENLASLRTGLLAERFELSRFIGRTLLYGADAPDDFLNQRSASVLKALTGGDPITVEFKNSNEVPGITCRFNVVITSNSRLTVHLEGDTDAWRRRLAIVRYTGPKPAHVIADLSERILREEGPGVLNFALEGLAQLRADGWQLQLNERQQRRVDDLLLESDSHGEFVRRCLVKDSNSTLTLNNAFAAYVEFCNESGWAAITRNQFGRRIPDAVVHEHRCVIRRDIHDGKGKDTQGWKGLRLRSGPGWGSEKASEPSAQAGSDTASEASEGLFPPSSGKIRAPQCPGLVEEVV